MGKWNELFMGLKNKHERIENNPPAKLEEIANVENTLGIQLPADLKELLLQINGDGWLIFSSEQIIETNLLVRTLDCYMPLDCLLFFGGNGCGDYYGYPITHEDGVRDDNVFMWMHEDDSRIWKATSLEDTIKKYYDGEI